MDTKDLPIDNRSFLKSGNIFKPISGLNSLNDLITFIPLFVSADEKRT